MRAFPRRLWRLLRMLPCALIAWSGAAGAADLYLTGELGMAAGIGETGGSVDLGPGGSFPNSGDDTDSSPVYGGALGYEFSLAEMFPADWDWSLPAYGLRVELEATGGRDYELVTNGPDPYVTKVGSWSVMNNFWMDFPLHAAVSRLMGRVPLLEPMSFYGGAGIGMASTEVKTTNNVFDGSDDALDFAWQAGAGFGYRLTDRVSVSLGYRYADLGDFSLALFNTPAPDPVGNLELAMTSHELAFGLRVRFFTVSSPGDWSVRRGR